MGMDGGWLTEACTRVAWCRGSPGERRSPCPARARSAPAADCFRGGWVAGVGVKQVRLDDRVSVYSGVAVVSSGRIRDQAPSAPTSRLVTTVPPSAKRHLVADAAEGAGAAGLVPPIRVVPVGSESSKVCRRSPRTDPRVRHHPSTRHRRARPGRLRLRPHRRPGGLPLRAAGCGSGQCEAGGGFAATDPGTQREVCEGGEYDNRYVYWL